MNQYSNSQYANPYSVANSESSLREQFYKKTYLHLSGALIALAAIETLLIKSSIAPVITRLFAGSNMSWAIVLGAFMVVSWLANKWAHSDTSEGIQYMGLGIYIIAEAFILLPIIYIAHVKFAEQNVLGTAAALTIFLFLALTVIAFFTKANFSFMKGFLTLFSMIAMGAIVASLIFGFNLGVWFSAAMCLLMGGYILYTTSNIIHEYNPKQHVAASLALFSSIATLFFYVLRLVMSFSNRD